MTCEISGLVSSRRKTQATAGSIPPWFGTDGVDIRTGIHGEEIGLGRFAALFK